MRMDLLEICCLCRARWSTSVWLCCHFMTSSAKAGMSWPRSAWWSRWKILQRRASQGLWMTVTVSPCSLGRGLHLLEWGRESVS